MLLFYSLAWPDRFFPFLFVTTNKNGKKRSGHARLIVLPIAKQLNGLTPLSYPCSGGGRGLEPSTLKTRGSAPSKVNQCMYVQCMSCMVKRMSPIEDTN